MLEGRSREEIRRPSRLPLRRAFWLVAGATLLAANASGAMRLHLGCEWSMAYSSFVYADDRATFVDDGRWLPRAAVIGTFDLPRSIRMSGQLEYVERGARNASRQMPFSEQQRLLERLAAFGFQWSRPIVLGFSLSAGPELTYLLDGDAQGTYFGGAGPHVDYRFDYTKGVGRWDLLTRFGVETEIPYGAHALLLHVRYVLGILKQERAGNYSDLGKLPWNSTQHFWIVESRTRATDFGLGFRW
jgi:hypothetical protein